MTKVEYTTCGSVGSLRPIIRFRIVHRSKTTDEQKRLRAKKYRKRKRQIYAFMILANCLASKEVVVSNEDGHHASSSSCKQPGYSGRRLREHRHFHKFGSLGCLLELPPSAASLSFSPCLTDLSPNFICFIQILEHPP